MCVCEKAARAQKALFSGFGVGERDDAKAATATPLVFHDHCALSECYEATVIIPHTH